jgi:hypothetical protein
VTRIPENVKRGVALLDERLPTWRQRVNPDTLDLANGCRCIVGQVLGDYDEGVALLGLSQRDAERYGFFTSGRQTFRSLTEAWQRVISRG